FMSFFQGPLFAILLLGIFWRKSTAAGGLIALVIGIGFSIFLHVFKGTFFDIQDPFLFISWWSFLLAFIINIVISLIKKHHSKEHLKGHVYNPKILNVFK